MNELSLYIQDIVENSINANARCVKVLIEEQYRDDSLVIVIEDDGRGMDEEELKKVFDPFYTTRQTRKVGLGIPLFKELAKLCGGDVLIDSIKGVKTKVEAWFQLSSIDLPPLGNLKQMLFCLVNNDKNVMLDFKYRKGDKEFSFSTLEVLKVLDGIPFSNPQVVTWFNNYVNEGIDGLNN